MKRNCKSISWHFLLLLASSIALTFQLETGRADEQPAAATAGEHQNPSTKPEGMSEMFQGTVVEVVDAGRHIYVRIHSVKQQVWVAVPVFDGKPGDEVLVPPGVPFVDFQSRKLNRTFKMIIFVGSLRQVHGSKAK